MWKTIAVVGATAAIVGGAGTVALAASGTATPTPSTSSSGSAAVSSASDALATGDVASTSPTGPGGHKGHRGHKGADRLRKAVHATWVSENKKTGTFTTHDAIRGRVTAVSPTSITVAAADSVTETYLLNSGTTVHTRVNNKKASIADVKTGDPVFVGGTGTATLTAIRIIDAKK